MLKAVLRWILVLGSLFAVGPLASELLVRLRDVDGGRAVTFLINGDAATALGSAAALLSAALIVGFIGSHFFSLNTGMASAGLVLAWARFDEGTLEGIVRRAGSGKDAPILAAEGVTCSLAAAAMTWVFVRAANKAQQAAGPAGQRQRTLLITGPVDEKPGQVALMSMGVGAAAAAVVVWFVALSCSPGQTFMATLAAGLAAGALSQVVAGSKDCHLSPLAPILSMAVVALVGPLAAAAINQGMGASFVDAVYTGRVLSLARPISLDWASGAMLGIPVGMGWAGLMLDKRHQT